MSTASRVADSGLAFYLRGDKGKKRIRNLGRLEQFNGKLPTQK